MFYKLALISDKYLQEREIFSNFVHNMKDEEFFLQKLQHHDIKPTANRLMIFRAMWRGDEAVSLMQLEHILHTIDKSTISRALNLFLLHGMCSLSCVQYFLLSIRKRYLIFPIGIRVPSASIALVVKSHRARAPARRGRSSSRHPTVAGHAFCALIFTRKSTMKRVPSPGRLLTAIVP